MKHIAFRKIIGEEISEVFVADRDGSNPRNLTNNPFFDGWPAWSPDGSKIAFASNRRGHGYQIFVMDADGADPRRSRILKAAEQRRDGRLTAK